MEHIANQQEDDTTLDLLIDHAPGGSQKTPKEITRTYDVSLKFNSRSDAMYAADMVREFQTLSLEMLQKPIVFEEAIEVVKTYKRSKRFKPFPSALGKQLKGKVEKHGRNIHDSTYTQALTLAKTYLTRGSQVQKMLELMDKDTFTQWLIFNRSFLLERRLTAAEE